MRTIKILAMLISFTLMSTGCRHDHHDHDEKSLKKEKTGHPFKSPKKKDDENHRH